jgi:hypothetical protein
MIILLVPLSATGQTDFDILAGKDKAVVNFQYANNFMLVEVRLLGMLPMWFIFDTGAEHTILFKKEFADIFNMTYDIRVPIVGSDQSKEVYALVVRGVDVEVLGLDPVERDILVLEEDYLKLAEITGRPIHGILGSSFFRNVVVQLDFKRQRIILRKPETFEKPDNSFHVFDVDIRSGKPYVRAQAAVSGDTTLDLTLLVDTGAGLPLLLHNNTDPRLRLPQNYIVGRLGLGLGGYVEGHLGRIDDLRLGDLSFTHIVTSFQDLSGSVTLDSSRFRNGLIGTQLLMRFQVYIDYIDEKMYLRPTGRYNKKFKMDRSGLVLYAMGQNLNIFVVQDTLANSPAAKADIHPGDVIRTIGGLPAGLHSLNSLLRSFQRRGNKRVRIVIQRKHELIRKHFRLEDLI